MEPKIKEPGSDTALATVYHESLLSLFWRQDRSNSRPDLRELCLSHKTRKETIKKDALTVGSIRMQYNVFSFRLNLTFFSTISYRDSQLMLFSSGNYLTHNGYWMTKEVLDGLRRN